MITRRKAISECKKLWKEIKESGLSKKEFLTTTQGKEWVEKYYYNDCPLCQYVGDVVGCGGCPLQNKGEDILCACNFLGYSYINVSSNRWFKTIERLKE